MMIGTARENHVEGHRLTQHSVLHNIVISFEQSNKISQPKMCGMEVQICVRAMVVRAFLPVDTE